ncbi:hypothetical protein BDQ94DRAFT_164561 [Aspergillus welwitschiae]|uniref:Uncharacterized protein n=1 Tax=Aspergillus welwitschiae TaxID=1341132 RepID=A0A3F3PJ11_9EURO|nr:hypothetical protein BDQ94DRAFT_164561 [Aspergillus welwitschiae]RDH26346.1 hypothetical protein BDQ94DRAFT_164561 [Aspergillus welwitschiae]
MKPEEEGQNEEQQQRVPQQTRAWNNRRTITDHCLRQRGGNTESTSGFVLPRSERERRRMVSHLTFLPTIMVSLQHTRSASQSRVFEQE